MSDLDLTFRHLLFGTILELREKTIMLILCNAVRVFLDTHLRPLAKREQGMSIVGFAILLALIAIAVALATPNIRAAVVALFGQAVTAMNAG